MEMVLTRNQSQKEHSHEEMENTQGASSNLVHSGEISDQHNRNTDQRRTEQIDTQFPVEDHHMSRTGRDSHNLQESRSYGFIENRNQHLTQSMHVMEDKVKSIEMTLKTVTDQLTNALRNLPNQTNSSNINQNQMTHDLITRPGHSRRQRSRPRSISHSDTDYDSEPRSFPSSGTHQYRSRTKPKLPPFTGRESWKVWYNRFEEVANRHRWSSEEKLDELLPRLQGIAGDFVFGQLNQTSRSNYHTLCKELGHRFRVVETSKSFRIQFSNRNQKSGETPEEYAAELKMLYDKAHTHRDNVTRQDDLLRRFLDGLADEKTRFYVEFVKEPVDIDEAVYQVVCFQETKSRSKDHNPMYSRQLQNEHSCCDSEGDISIARSAPVKNKHKLIQNETDKTSDSNTLQADSNISDLEKIREIIRSELKAMPQSQPYSTPKQYNRPYKSNRYNKPERSYNPNFRNNRSCFLCGDPTHFKRNCPHLNDQTSSSALADQNKQPLNYNGLAAVANSQS